MDRIGSNPVDRRGRRAGSISKRSKTVSLLELYTAQSVCLVGDFNGWNPFANPMRQQPDGCWFAQVQLTHGHHRYCFLVDGEPTLDPAGAGVTRNDRNEPVSLIAVS